MRLRILYVILKNAQQTYCKEVTDRESRLSELAASQEHFLPVVQGCGKKVGVSSLGQLEPLAQVGYGSGEVAHGEIGLSYVFQQFLHFMLAEAAPTVDAEPAAGKVR